ncbi:hypothetical protein [Streptomyces sp. NPDC012888]|uniref:hypothetical protein n=1 Tax=Streptomyces sp. NPDC012888 TaxID=3364855 RepID=UPI003684E642
MDTTRTPVPPSLPLQAPPVFRQQSQEPQERNDSYGVEAARSGCAELWGPARQMCYAQRAQAV